MMYRIAAFIQCYNLDVMMTESFMNVIGASICFAMLGTKN